MADNEEGKDTTSRGNEWEVVSLTASAYAAAPGPKEIDLNDADKGNLVVSDEAESGPKQIDLNDADKGNLVASDDAETSHAMFMSGHFVFPPSWHENLPLEPETTEIQNEQGGEVAAPELATEEGGKSDTKDEESWNIKELTVTDEFPGIQFLDEKGNRLSISGTEFEEGTTLQELNLVDKEQTIYSTAKFSSFHSEAAIGDSNTVEESQVITEPIEPSDQSLESDIPHLQKPRDENKYDGSDLPCEAWWKRRAASLYAHAKEANAFWSIFIAAAVMGLVILGQRWQQERWQVLQLKWQFGINDERMGRMLGPISRFKDVLVGGHRRGSSIRGSTSTER